MKLNITRTLKPILLGVMLGLAFETILVLMVIAYSEEIEKIGPFPKKEQKPKQLLIIARRSIH
jgi:hypothetical protein